MGYFNRLLAVTDKNNVGQNHYRGINDAKIQ